ncbi:DUF1223 domain-containing protein [Aliiroseovarius subalbicans]|uniref:DUF1223 domain-containing protein n=1 Tax=Aliiroseovarius subalbicans TaxID=2925840 RepID=UPI001F5923CA|nr:DUF1223 domain-containing protein [Aliiroseovarius subalbicans]MCI2398867.1 DUF1223 domain-containing protein [Aliiroseovarius subalbicans]
MRRIFAIVMALFAALGTAWAEPKPLVVVELFTSQGCSSCPPADALLAQLAEERADVLPLALHVDYWDYIGWADKFARPEHTARQKAYAHAAGMRSIYTPQMVVGGVDHVIGHKPMKVADFLAAHRAAMGRVGLTGRVEDGVAFVRAEPREDLPRKMVAQLVQFTARETVNISRGENAGKSISYANIVTDLHIVGEWDGIDAFETSIPVPKEGSLAILIQASGAGPILAAIQLR